MAQIHVLGSNGEVKSVTEIMLGSGGAGGTVTTWTPSTVTLVANVSATLKAANAAAVRRIIRNPLATPLFVRFGAAAATTAAGGHDIVVPAVSSGVPGQFIFDPSAYKGEIRGICATAGDVGVSEGV